MSGDKITDNKSSIHVRGENYIIQNALIGIDIAGQFRSLSLDWRLISSEPFFSEDAYGKLQGYRKQFFTPGNLLVEWCGGVYDQKDIFSCWMSVKNNSEKDVYLQALVPLCARGTEGGAVYVEGAESIVGEMLSIGKWMGFSRELTLGLDSRKNCESYHISAIMDRESRRGIVFGMGERTNTIVKMEASANHTGFDLAITGQLDVDLQANPLRLAPGKTFEMNRVVILSGNDIFSAFEDYGVYLARYMKIDSSKIRFVSGIFCVYGQEKADTDDWEKIALTDERMEEFMDVADRHLKPYGLTYLKSQFGGASSGPSHPNGLNIFFRREWTDASVWPVPENGESLPDLIEEKGFTPDTCDISRYHPNGVAYMCRRVHDRGYRNALVCRPYLNVRAGSQEREELCADIFRMAVKKWGYDYLMFDFNRTDFETDQDDRTIAENMTLRFETVRKAVGPEIYIEACMIMPGCVLGLVDSYRPATDWRGATEEDLVGPLTSLYFLNGKVFALDSEFFDPDLTPFVWGNSQNISTRIRYFGSLERVKSWTSWCGLTGYNLFTGGVIDDVSEERWHIFSRMLPVWGHTAVPLDIGQTQRPAVWKLTGENCAGPYTVVGLFNWDSLRQKRVKFQYDQLRFDPSVRYIALSFWDGKVYELCEDMEFILPPSGCIVLIIREMKNEPMYLGSDRHVTNAYGLRAFSYNWGKSEICGIAEAPAGTEVIHYLYVPDGRGPAVAEGCEFEISQPGVIRITTKIQVEGSKNWKLSLDLRKKTI